VGPNTYTAIQAAATSWGHFTISPSAPVVHSRVGGHNTNHVQAHPRYNINFGGRRNNYNNGSHRATSPAPRRQTFTFINGTDILAPMRNKYCETCGLHGWLRTNKCPR
jgi:hypothetical protein